MELDRTDADVARLHEREQVHHWGIPIIVAVEHPRCVVARADGHRVELLSVVAVVDLVPGDPVVGVGATLGGHPGDGVAGEEVDLYPLLVVRHARSKNRSRN